jgi:hypothetical protein
MLGTREIKLETRDNFEGIRDGISAIPPAIDLLWRLLYGAGHGLQPE